MYRSAFTALLTATLFTAPSAQAQMTDASTIRPILEATKANWIGVRRWDGQDLVYFTHLETWKCGLKSIRYGINSEEATKRYAFKACKDDEAAPSPVATDRLPYIAFVLDSVETVTITLTYDDGMEVTETFDRAAVEIP